MVAAAQTAVTCTWCGQYFPSRPANGHCDNCTGPLPAPSGAGRGAAPPTAPRVLPSAYRRQVMVSRNVLTILGIVFSPIGATFMVVAGAVAVAGAQVLLFVFGPLGLVFAVVGASLLMAGLGRGRRRLAALEHGAPAEGEVVSVALNQSERINGRHPWSIEYTFNTPGGPARGTVQSWALVDGDRRAGDHVWVVYLPADPETSTLWPPVR